MNPACAFCGNHLSLNAAGILGRCPQCGAPQPLSPSEDYFQLLGRERKFAQDPKVLETAFYSLSRELHPDRFAAGTDPKWKLISIERMSRVNEAYRVLTKRDQLRPYLLELEGFSALEGQSSDGAKTKAKIPLELAEEWFEIQESEPAEVGPKLTDFESNLDLRIQKEELEIQKLEAEFDSSASREALGKIEKLLLEGQYLKSLKRDVLKLKGAVK